MSIFDAETSREDSSPRELFLFVQGESAWGFTGSDTDVVYDGRTYLSTPIARTQSDMSQEITAGAIQIIAPADNPVMALFATLTPTARVYVTVIRFHRNGTASAQFVGVASQVTFGDGFQATMDCIPIPGVLSRTVPSLAYQTQCNWATYGARCGVNVAAFTDVIPVDSIVGVEMISSGAAARPDDWFTGGMVRIRSGPRAGDLRFVVAHVGAQLTLNAPLVGVVAGDQVDAIAGDDHLESTCTAKFNNLARFLGFSRIPITNPHVGRMS